MYLEKDRFLNEYKKELKDDEEVKEFLEKCFPGLEIKETRKSYLLSELVFLSYVCYCYSINELSSMMGNYFSSGSVRKRLTLVKNDKRGLLGELSFQHRERGARKAYRVTPAGYKDYLGNLPDNIKPHNGQVVIRRSGKYVPGHDYGIGISLLSLMLLEKPFSFRKEDLFSAGRLARGKGTVCVDCTVRYDESDGTRYFYIEQDMGNEPALTLVSKLHTYYRLGMTLPNTSIIFSSHEIMDFEECPSYVLKELSCVCDDMKEKGMDGVYEYYKAYGATLEESVKLSLMAFLVRVGICDAYDNEQSVAYGKKLMPHKVTTSSFLKQAVNITYIKKCEEVSALAEDFTLSQLCRYVEDLHAGSNPYRVKEYNKAQYHAAKNKLHNMSDIFFYYLDKGQYIKDNVLCLLGGYSCYMVPSVLLSNSAKYFMPWSEERISLYRKVLSPYYKGIEQASYKEIGTTMVFSGAASVTPRNVFTLPDNRIVAMEHIGQDLGGIVRCYYLCKMSRLFPDLPIHLVCICDEDADMLYFCKAARYCVESYDFPEDAPFYISFLTESELSSDLCYLRSVCDIDEEPMVVSVRTKAQYTEFLQYVKEYEAKKKMPAPPVKEESSIDLSSMSLADLFS